MKTSEPLLVGIDAGGSKMHLRLISASSGAVLDDRVVANSNWANLSNRDRARGLAEGVDMIVSGRAGVLAVVAGVHGNDSEAQGRILAEPLQGRFPLLSVINDSQLLVPAQGWRSGVGVVAGTGSSVTAIGKDGQAVTVGGWGWFLGDEGSGAGLVRDAARRVLWCHDADVEDPLVQTLLGALQLQHAPALFAHLLENDPREWSRAAPAIFAAHRQGSRQTDALIQGHASALVDSVALASGRGGDASAIVCAGGVFTGEPIFFEAFAAQVARRLGPAIPVKILQHAPVVGALNLARNMVLARPDLSGLAG